MTGLSDSFQRPINYLRISVTDRCNLRCIYCMPEEGIELFRREEMLSFEEIVRAVTAAAGLGITKVRLTGGEPLIRTGLSRLVAMLAQIKDLDDISLTTNGLLLAEHAAQLKGAGLRRVNISLDTLKPERFETITRGKGLEKVLEGIRIAHEVGLVPVKINMVVMRGINDGEISDFGRKSLEDSWHVRFIELMPFGQDSVESPRFVPVSEIQQRLQALGRMEPGHPGVGGGPAKYFRFPGASGTIGFISPVSEHFCISCNRLRLTADGQLRLCLLNDDEIGLRTALRNGASNGELQELFRRAIACKPERHHLGEGIRPRGRDMAHMGG